MFSWLVLVYTCLQIDVRKPLLYRNKVNYPFAALKQYQTFLRGFWPRCLILVQLTQQLQRTTSQRKGILLLWQAWSMDGQSTSIIITQRPWNPRGSHHTYHDTYHVADILGTILLRTRNTTPFIGRRFYQWNYTSQTALSTSLVCSVMTWCCYSACRADKTLTTPGKKCFGERQDTVLL